MPHLFILENDPARVEAMTEVLGELSATSATIIDNAPEAIQWLTENLSKVALISLDHDLGGEYERSGIMFDPGSGRDVAAFLGKASPCCPVIVHTDNFFVRPTMQASLDEAGWQHSHVSPGNGTRWVREQWLPAVKSKIGITD